MINLLDNTPSQTSRFRTKNWVEMNDDSCGTYNTNGQIKFKNSMLKSNFCDYSDAYIVVKGTMLVANTGGGEVIFKICAPVTDCIRKINNTQIDNVKGIDAAMPMYNLIECSDNYSKISENLWQYYRDEPALANAIDFPATNNNSALFNFKQKITDKTGADNTKYIEIIVLLNSLSDFWRTLGMPLINRVKLISF